jgi:hypothetical protein
MVTKLLDRLLIVALNVSLGSTRLSLLIGTLKVKVVPAADPAGKLMFRLLRYNPILRQQLLYHLWWHNQL